MWQGDETPYAGMHYQLVRPLNAPNSVQRPHPPIMIGGSGERKTLRLVAQYADACNLFDLPGTEFADNLPHKLAVLRKHCADLGRDYATIEKTVASRFTDTAELLARLRELAAIGFDHVLVTPGGPWDDRTLDAVAALLPAVHALAGTAD